MDDALIQPTCPRSLCATVDVCEKQNLGYEIDQGAGAARFYRNDRTVKEMTKEGKLFTFNIEDESSYDSCEEGGEAMIASGEGEYDEFEPLDAQLHEQVLLTSGSGDVCHGCACAAAGESWMLPHALNGHRPNRRDCKWCSQAYLSERKAKRSSLKMAVHHGVSTAAGFTGPHEPCNDGYKYGFVAVAVKEGCENAVGFFAPQESRFAPDTLKSIKRFETFIKVKSEDPDARIVSWHHDDDKSFRGEVEDYAVEHGWKDTHTRGYRPSANSVSERRISMLHQVFRVLLLYATGGQTYYESLWSNGLKWANEVVNYVTWQDGSASPYSQFAGREMPVPESTCFWSLHALQDPKGEEKWQVAA